MKICPECGRVATEGSRSCVSCGYPLIGDEAGAGDRGIGVPDAFDVRSASAVGSSTGISDRKNTRILLIIFAVASAIAVLAIGVFSLSHTSQVEKAQQQAAFEQSAMEYDEAQLDALEAELSALSRDIYDWTELYTEYADCTSLASMRTAKQGLDNKTISMGKRYGIAGVDNIVKRSDYDGFRRMLKNKLEEYKNQIQEIEDRQ